MSYVDNTFQSPAVLSICTGMRGLETGVERVIGPVRVVTYVEIEAFVIQNLVAQMEQGVLAPAPVWTNVKTFPSELFRDRVHGIIGGYPCQPFSFAGLRRGEQDPRHLWPYIKSMVGAIKPVWCFFENVAGHLNLGYRSVRQDLFRLGYTVEEGLFSAEEVGAPHLRKRLFILAVADTYNRQHARESRENEKKNEEIQKWNNDKKFSDTVALADAYIKRRDKKRSRKLGADQHSDKAMANANIVYGREQQQLSCGEGSGPWDQPAGSGTLANSISQGLEGRRQQEDSKGTLRSGWMPASWSSADSRSQWPAPPGPTQHDWEHPRTIESRLGYAVNGYNHREDLLRMAGNAVVPQTAEKAFITLLKRFL